MNSAVLNTLLYPDHDGRLLGVHLNELYAHDNLNHQAYLLLFPPPIQPQPLSPHQTYLLPLLPTPFPKVLTHILTERGNTYWIF